MKSLLNALQDGRLVELPESDKEKSLRYLAHLIEAIPEIGGNLELAEEMLAREAAANTGIGLGVACPHVRGPGTGELLCAVGWSPSGIDYGSKDGRKVYLVVMYYIPESQKNMYLKEVSALAGAVKKEGSIQQIAKASDIASVREELLNWVSAAIDASVPEAKARMIRLEARQAALAQAELPPLGAIAGQQVQLVPVLFLMLVDSGKPVVLSPKADLSAALERDNTLAPLLKQEAQFDRLGYRFVHRKTTLYDPNRPLYDYLALKVG
jgi:PTS system nitrogen regulatory IIA component